MGPARSWTARGPVTGLGVLTVLVPLAFVDGGFYPTTWGLATLALLVALSACTLWLRRVEAGPLDAAIVAALGALTLWTVASAAWSIDPAASLLEAQRTLLYAVAAAVLVAGTRSGAGPALLAAVLAACTIVSAYALVAGPAAPLGYANAVGAVAAIGLVLAAGLAARRSAAAAAALVPLACALWLSGSRAAIVAAAVGIAMTLAMRRGRATAVALAIVAAASVAWLARDSLQARAPMWSVAWEAAERHPALGLGAGGFDRAWWQARPVARGAREAHSLYLEVLAELGPVGLALLSLALVAPLVAASRARGQPLVPVAAGAYVTFLVHAGVDWDWEMPAVTLTGLVCAAALLLQARPSGRSFTVTSRSRVAVSLVVLLVTGAAYAGYAGNAALERARAAAAIGSPATAAAAEEAARWAPWSSAPWLAAGEAALRRGDHAAARLSLRRGLARDAGDWELWAVLARASRGEDRRAAASRALALNPLGGPDG